MGVRVLHDERKQAACFYCSVTGWAFGPVFRADLVEDDDASAIDLAYEFLRWFDRNERADPWSYADKRLEVAYVKFLAERREEERIMRPSDD